MISYRLVFTEVNGKIDGYSVTDLQGENETKNKITGTYNSKTRILDFKEKDIEYTKSIVSKNNFCYLHFTGKVTISEKSSIKGKFNGLFKDGKECINGSLELVGSKKAFDRITKINQKFQKSKKIDPVIKENVDLNKTVSSLKVNTLRKNEKTSFFVDSASIQIEIWDNAKEDGDEVSIYVDDKILLKNYKALNEKKYLNVPLDKMITTIRIEANNTGTIGKNTVVFAFSDNKAKIELISDLEKNDITTIRIIKEK